MPSWKSSFIILCLWQSSLFVAVTWAESNGITSRVCHDFQVDHDGSREVEEPGQVQVLLRNFSGLPQSCYNQGETYTVELFSPRLLKGFLLQASRGGKFPDMRPHELPEHTRKAPCSRSVTHSESRTNRCPPLIFRYTAPNYTDSRQDSTDRIPSVFFRYTVVFDMMNHIQNQMQVFPPCPTLSRMSPTPTPTPTPSPSSIPPPTSTPTSSLALAPTPTPSPCSVQQDMPVDTICGRNLTSIINIQHTAEDGTVFDCTLNDPTKPIKRVSCVPHCESEGQRLCCGVDNSSTTVRRKRFSCYPQGSDRIPDNRREFVLLVTISRQCTCHVCSTNTC